MIKKFFELLEATITAVSYLLVLLMILAVVSLGAYLILFIAIRIGGWFHELILKEPWI